MNNVSNNQQPPLGILNTLPNELLEIILLDNNLGIGTISRCRQACKTLNQFIIHKNIFERCLIAYIPDNKMINYWEKILSNYNDQCDRNYISFSQFFCNIILKKGYNHYGNNYLFGKLLKFLYNEKDPAKLKLLQYILHRSFEYKFFINRTLLFHYDGFKTIQQSQISLTADKYQSDMINKSLSTLSKERIIEAKISIISNLYKSIKKLYKKGESDITTQRFLDALILLAYDKNIKVASKARNVLLKLLNSSHPTYLTYDQKAQIAQLLSISLPIIILPLQTWVISLSLILTLCSELMSYFQLIHSQHQRLQIFLTLFSIGTITYSLHLGGRILFQSFLLLYKSFDYDIHLSLRHFNGLIINFILTTSIFLTTYFTSRYFEILD